jgi:predicted phage terminase large subunit-like protein
MPINRNVKDQEKLKRLAVLIDEAERRGLEIDRSVLNKDIVFPVDSNGYFVKRDGTRYAPNENQENFVLSDSVLTAFISGRGGGKSCAGAQKALKKISQGESGAVFNPKFEDFKTSTWLEFRSWIPWDMVVPSQRYRGQEHWEPSQPFTLTFMNGARVLCKGLKDPDSARGPNINWLWYDEAGSDGDGLSWQIALASVRVGKDIQAWITTTPKGKRHWIYKFFVKQDIPEEALEEFNKSIGNRGFIEMFYSSIWENKDNLNPIYFANMLAAYPSGWLRQQELEGKFVDEGGTLGDRRWFSGKVLPDKPETVSGRIRYWDLAATEKKTVGQEKNDPDETVGTKLSWIKDGTINEKGIREIGKFYIENQYSGFWKYEQLLDEITQIAELDGPYVTIWLEQEPGSGGKNQVAAIKKHIQNKLGNHYKVEGHNPRDLGDKVMRANVWFAEAANGQFFMVRGNWNEGFLDQLDEFTGESKNKDDKIDSVSGARHCLAPIKSWTSIEFLSV